MKKPPVSEHDADPHPEGVYTSFGYTVACAEGRCDCCPGSRRAYAKGGAEGPCTHPCHDGSLDDFDRYVAATDTVPEDMPEAFGRWLDLNRLRTADA